LAGVVNDGTPFSSNGGLDGGGNAYSANLLGSSLSAGGYSFALGTPGASDVVQATGQTITVPAGSYSTLAFLGTAVNGTQANQTFTVNYSDGTSDTFTQSLSDWHTPQGYDGESTAAAMTYRDVYDGTQHTGAYSLYLYSFSLNRTRYAKSRRPIPAIEPLSRRPGSADRPVGTEQDSHGVGPPQAWLPPRQVRDTCPRRHWRHGARL
jgi:hypothetical protein